MRIISIRTTALGVTAFAAATMTAAMTGVPVYAQSANSDLPAIDVTVNKPKPRPRRKRPAAQPRQEAAPEPQQASGREAPKSGPATGNPGTPSGAAEPVYGQAGAPGGQTVTGVERERTQYDPVFTVGDLVKHAPGVSIKQGNGPRDMTISIRGSNARNGFAIRNTLLFEDGFPVTQADGLGRADLIDPHAYSGADVWRGPSSALFGNYATGGAINFRTRTGHEIDGVEYGIDVGSFGYLNNYVTAGGKAGNVEGAVFMSDVRGDGYFGYSSFDTQTINALVSFKLTPQDKVTFKFIDNELYIGLPYRLSMNQYKQNPYQKGCETFDTAAPGCASNLFQDYATGVAKRQTAEQSGANRNDRRTIGGVRWEHDIDPNTLFRLQYVIDDRNISQPTGNTGGVGDFLSHNVISDISTRARILGFDTVSMIGAYWNYLPVDSKTYNIGYGPDTPFISVASELEGYTMNWGVRAREEVALNKAWNVIGGVDVERSVLNGTNQAYRYNNFGVPQAPIAPVSADRQFINIAPELGLLYKPNREWQVRARVGTGYGVPQISNLFVTPDGDSGNNTDLQPQTNVGYDLGFDWTPSSKLSFSLTGFYEFFQNEIVSQGVTNSGAANQTYQFNAPASEHRGLEAAIDWRPYAGWRLTGTYLLNDQVYTDYTEILSRQPFVRDGNKIPGVAPNEVLLRLGYDQPDGPLKGLGAYVEYQWREAFYMDNANLLKAPDADFVNINVHYALETPGAFVKSSIFYFEVKNVFDNTYIAGANNIPDAAGSTAASLANSTGFVYAGSPQAFFGGVKFKY